ncbi:hypothetical protein [Micromonospora cathayae]|uniref:TIGR02611 family protein n=1 Tax=Micromonospora cathayae TaxID=3028804 RepID=A0ABY7ZMW4_9ACTN|nr:hypothetical protein [Micromonospora sp. HUAS 3]WDZ84319.1 hypothetical protein PVK37_28350 [Micromonospora sp. HUAS 3]
MSKERARLRAAREAERERQQAVRARRVARRDRRRALVRRLTPRRRRTGRLLARRSRGERAGIVVLTLAVLALIWTLVPDPALRVLLIVLLLLVLPAIVVIALDRRT